MLEGQKANSPWWQSGLQLFARLSAWICGPIIIAVFLGKYLDTKFHSDPWLFLATVVATFVFSIIQIVRIGMKELNKK
jgi:F0F1-type ATP synthase assembly protein I